MGGVPSIIMVFPLSAGDYAAVFRRVQGIRRRLVINGGMHCDIFFYVSVLVECGEILSLNNTTCGARGIDVFLFMFIWDGDNGEDKETIVVVYHSF